MSINRRLAAHADALLSREQGTVRKDPGGRIRVCLVYPNTYRVGMSSLGFQGIYGLLNRRDDVVCERAFLPDDGDYEEYVRTGTPVFSLESKLPLSRFDIVAVSVSFENDYPHLLRLLQLSKIPLRAAARGRYDPLVIGGGACLSFNPEPLAPFFDMVFVGEAEELLDEFFDRFRTHPDRGALKREAAALEGIYVPEFAAIAYDAEGHIVERRVQPGTPERVRRRVVGDLSRSAVTTAILTPEAEFSNMHLIEAMRGCPWSCRFCLVGHACNPPRKKDLAQITQEIGRVREGPARAARVGLIGPSLTDYPHVKEVLCMEGVEFSITSLRAGSRSAELVALLGGNRSVSIAPEAGTERMRRVINKKITEEDILQTARLIFETGIETLRLYFMIGLPTETDGDLEGIAALIKKIRALSTKGGLTASVSTFVPKPFTPFQWHPMESLGAIKRKLKSLKDALKGERGVRVLHDVPKYALMQGLFARGDRRVAAVVEGMLGSDDWKGACAAAGIDEEFYLFRRREREEPLPWDFIDAGLPKETLWADYREALRQ